MLSRTRLKQLSVVSGVAAACAIIFLWAFWGDGFFLFLGEQESIAVKVFFGNRFENPGIDDCRAVYPVERRVPKTKAVARAALTELLRGPTALEEQKGFFTSINQEVRIQHLSVEAGVAVLDASRELEFPGGGSCRVAAIRAQIEATLRQFPSVRGVVLSIDGRTEDILQP